MAVPYVTSDETALITISRIEQPTEIWISGCEGPDGAVNARRLIHWLASSEGGFDVAAAFREGCKLAGLLEEDAT